MNEKEVREELTVASGFEVGDVAAEARDLFIRSLSAGVMLPCGLSSGGCD